jgi:hypothetical protein
MLQGLTLSFLPMVPLGIWIQTVSGIANLVLMADFNEMWHVSMMASCLPLLLFTACVSLDCNKRTTLPTCLLQLCLLKTNVKQWCLCQVVTQTQGMFTSHHVPFTCLSLLHLSFHSNLAYAKESLFTLAHHFLLLSCHAFLVPPLFVNRVLLNGETTCPS